MVVAQILAKTVLKLYLLSAGRNIVSHVSHPWCKGTCDVFTKESLLLAIL